MINIYNLKTTIIINIRIGSEDTCRLTNLQILLGWLENYYPNIFDILIIEQDITPRIDLSQLPGKFRHQFLYNPMLFNRGWGFNVAVRSFCEKSEIVVFFDSDILPSSNLLDCVIKCKNEYDVVSPYKNIYYTTKEERDGIRNSYEKPFVYKTPEFSNPVTICGGILIVKKSVFERVYGFEQYIGYGGEDRALDVTLLNMISANRIYVAGDTYIHLYHPREEIDRSKTEGIMRHLLDNYGCKWHKEIADNDYIHKLCEHKNAKQLEGVIDIKRLSYGNADLYKKNSDLTINGIEANKLNQRKFLSESSRHVINGNYDISMQCLNEFKSIVENYPRVFADIVNQRLKLLSKEKIKNNIYDFVFIPHKKYHTYEFIEAVKVLKEHGYSAVIVNPSPPHPDEGAFIDNQGNLFIDFNSYIKSGHKTSCIVCANDWERPVVQPLLRIAKYHNIPTVAVVEGVNDFHDVDVRIPGSPAHFRNAYGTAKYIVLNGTYDSKYFTNPNQNISVAGINRLQLLNKYAINRNVRDKSAKKKVVLINLNFSYGVKRNDAESWLHNVIKACKWHGYNYVISKHPQDDTPTYDHPVSKKHLYDDLVECDVLVTRFSGAIFEALVIGVPIVYFNPSIEKIDKFKESMGAYCYAKSFEEMESALKSIDKIFDPLRVSRFLELHVGWRQGEEYLPYMKLVDLLKNIYFNHALSETSLKNFCNSVKEHYSSGQLLVRNPTNDAKELYIDPNYSIGDNVVFCKCLNVDIENLDSRIVVIQGRLYLLKCSGVAEALLIPAITWNEQSKNHESLIIHDIDIDPESINVTGFVYDLSKTKRPLKSGLTFLIRAKNEFRNIYFVLRSLRAVLRNKRFNCEVVFVDNNSDDGTYDEVIRNCRSQEIDNVYLYKYPVDVSRSGDEHISLPANGQMNRSLDTFYNWCLDKANKFNIIKWDADFLAINDNLIDMIERYNLHTTDEMLSIWCSGKTLYKNKELSYVNLDTEYNEFRVFSKAKGYKWIYAPRWEISSQEYLAASKKVLFTKSVFLELKDCEINEFANRTNGTHITTCTRDTRDSKIIELVRTLNVNTESLRALGLQEEKFPKINFNPLLPRNYDTVEFNNYFATDKELRAAQSYWINVYSKPDNPVQFSHNDNIIVQGLWVGKEITDLHRICLQSFVKAGHCFILYTYEEVKNVPPEVVIMSAEDIIPSTLIYSFNGSFAGFSDLFRSKLMEVRGGWYVDLDIFCLKRLDIPCDTVFSLDHYSEKSPHVYAKDGLRIFPTKDHYYCATNPLKLKPRTEITKWMYATVLKKLVSNKLLVDVFNNDQSLVVERQSIIDYLGNLRILDDVNQYITQVGKLSDSVVFNEVLDAFSISIDDVGQKTWNEIGPKLVSEAALRFAQQKDLFDPIWFQGLIPYYEVEKYISPDYDYSEILNSDKSYTVDLFFTMWKNKGLLDKKDNIENTFYSYLKNFVEN